MRDRALTQHVVPSTHPSLHKHQMSIGQAVFVQLPVNSAYTLYWGGHAPKIAPSPGGIPANN